MRRVTILSVVFLSVVLAVCLALLAAEDDRTAPPGRETPEASPLATDGEGAAGDEAETAPAEGSEKPAAEKSDHAEADEAETGDKTSAADEEEKTPKRPTHEDKAFKERVEQRATMVREQMEERDIKSKAVLDAIRTVPRHAFVPERHLWRAYHDTPLPIGHGQTISQPYIVAYMTEQMQLGPKDKVLEIGTGSGYQAAVAAEIVAEVYSVEIIKELGEAAGKRLEKLGYENVTTRVADGYHGWEEHGPFDAIIVTAAAQHVPPPLVKQLRPGGRMIIPVGGPLATQYLILVTRSDEGDVRTRALLPVRFVPLTRATNADD